MIPLRSVDHSKTRLKLDVAFVRTGPGPCEEPLAKPARFLGLKPRCHGPWQASWAFERTGSGQRNWVLAAAGVYGQVTSGENKSV